MFVLFFYPVSSTHIISLTNNKYIFIVKTWIQDLLVKNEVISFAAPYPLGGWRYNIFARCVHWLVSFLPPKSLQFSGKKKRPNPTLYCYFFIAISRNLLIHITSPELQFISCKLCSFDHVSFSLPPFKLL